MKELASHTAEIDYARWLRNSTGAFFLLYYEAEYAEFAVITSALIKF
jgi:hypothetical protein